MTTPSNNGRRLIEEYERAISFCRQQEARVVDARNSLDAATLALAKHLAPSDAKPGETFGIWERDANNREVLYRVSFSSVSGPLIEKRYR